MYQTSLTKGQELVAERMVREFRRQGYDAFLITHSTLWNGPEEVAKFMGWRRELIASGSIHEHMLFCHMSHFQEPSDERYPLEERSYREAWNKFSLARIVKDADMLLVTTPM